MYELVIIGGGPGGVAAGVYAARKKLKTALVTESFGGQSIVSDDIQNWIGTKCISGFELAQNFEEHLRVYEEDLDIMDGVKAESILKTDDGFTVKTGDGKELQTKTVLITSGSRRKKLSVPGNEEYDGKGIAYCATCDAPIFKDKDVAVVGGGNAGLEAVIDLLPYAKKVYLLHYKDELKGDETVQEKIKANPRVEILLNANTTEIFGDKFVTGMKYEDKKTNEIKTLDVGGVFVEIGALPNTEFVKDLVEMNKIGEIVVDHKTQKSSVDGIWAAGDASDVLYKQNNISAGDAIKAILNINTYINDRKEAHEY